MYREKLNKLQSIEDKVEYLGQVITRTYLQFPQEEHRVVLSNLTSYYRFNILDEAVYAGAVAAKEPNKINQDVLARWGQILENIDHAVRTLEDFIESQRPVKFEELSLPHFIAIYNLAEAFVDDNGGSHAEVLYGELMDNIEKHYSKEEIRNG